MHRKKKGGSSNVNVSPEYNVFQQVMIFERSKCKLLQEKVYFFEVFSSLHSENTIHPRTWRIVKITQSFDSKGPCVVSSQLVRSFNFTKKDPKYRVWLYFAVKGKLHLQ